MKIALLTTALSIAAPAAAQTFVNPPEIAPPLARYSHVATVPAGSDLLVLAGQVGNAPDGALAPDTEAQYERALGNIVAILRVPRRSAIGCWAPPRRHRR